MTHSFDTEIAKEYGVNCAIILQHLFFWIEKNRANEKNYHDGRYWTYNSVKAFSELFPYMTDKQIRTALKTLESEGLVITGNYNSSAYDRTKWYALTDRALSIFLSGNNDLPKKANGSSEKGEPIPDNKTDNKPDIKPDNIYISACAEPTTKKQIKHKYGEYKNVLLSDDDLEKLKDQFPDWEKRIERLSEYMASTGKSYKNHLATIRNWARRDLSKKPEKRQASGNPFLDMLREEQDRNGQNRDY